MTHSARITPLYQKPCPPKLSRRECSAKDHTESAYQHFLVASNNVLVTRITRQYGINLSLSPWRMIEVCLVPWQHNAAAFTDVPSIAGQLVDLFVTKQPPSPTRCRRHIISAVS
jgi:hypothetical protein